MSSPYLYPNPSLPRALVLAYRAAFPGVSLASACAAGLEYALLAAGHPIPPRPAPASTAAATRARTVRRRAPRKKVTPQA